MFNFFGQISKILIQFYHCEFGGGGGGKGGGGGGGGYSPPPAPDPAQTAAAQTAANVSTAQANAYLLNPTIQSPMGSITYDTNSTTVDPGNTGAQSITRPTQTINLSPAQQSQLTARNNITGYLDTAGQNLASSITGNPIMAPNQPPLPTSIDYSNVANVPNPNQYSQDVQNVAQSYYNQAYGLMQPALQQQQAALQNQLIQSGNPLNSQDYNTQMGNFYRNEDSALSSLANQSVGQGYNVQNQLFNNQLAGINSQISLDQLPYQTAYGMQQNQLNQNMQIANENTNLLSSLLNGTQAIQMPSGAGYNQAALQSPPIGNYINQAYQNQLGAYNTGYGYNLQSQNAYNSGLFGLGAAGIGALGSFL